jgi:hypothetical protein
MIINLTPHPVAIYGNRTLEEGPREVIPPSGTVARVATIDLGTQPGRSGSYELVEYGHVHDLPEAAPDKHYLVSLVVALAARGRDDLLAPYVEVRNAEGMTVGCRYLQKVC